MKSRAGSNPQLEWLLQQTAVQFLTSPHLLRRRDRQAWRVAARDAFCLVAHMHQLGTPRQIAAALGRDDLDSIRQGLARAASRLCLHNDVTTLATQVLGRLVAEALIQKTGPFSPMAEKPLKTPFKRGVTPGRGGLTTRPPSLACTPGHIAAQPTSSRNLDIQHPEMVRATH